MGFVICHTMLQATMSYRLHKTGDKKYVPGSEAKNLNNLKEAKNNTQVLFCRFSSFLQKHMQMPMKPCPMKAHSVDRLTPIVRKESLTARSGPAFQAVSKKSDEYSSNSDSETNEKYQMVPLGVTGGPVI